jgi:hypothetical protein
MFEKVKAIRHRLLRILNGDLCELIEQQELLLRIMQQVPCETLAELQDASPQLKGLTLNRIGPEANKQTEHRIATIENKKDQRTRFWIGMLLLIIVLAVLAAFCVSSPFSQAIPDCMRFWTGIGLLLFVLAISLLLSDPPPNLPLMILRVTLAISTALILATAPGTLDMEIPRYLKASGSLGVFALILFYTPRARPIEMISPKHGE